MDRGHSVANYAAAVPFVALFALALYWTQQQYRATRALDAGDAATAVRIWPAQPAAWRLLAVQQETANPAAALASARRALAAGPEDWQNWALVAELQEETGDMAGARASMRQMSTRAVGFEAHWRYANLLLVDGDTAGFWTQLQTALAFAPANELAMPLQQAWAVAAGDQALFTGAVRAAEAHTPEPAQPVVLDSAVLAFLLDQNQYAAAAPWWQSLAARALDRDQRAAARSLGRRYLDLLAQAGAVGPARAAIAAALAHGLFTAAEVPGTANAISDPNFALAAGAAALGWDVCDDCGPWVSRAAPGLDLNFQGDQSDSLVLAHQPLLLDPNTRYRLDLTATLDGHPCPGLAATVFQLDGLVPQAAEFTTAAQPTAYIVEITYNRPKGEMPLRGDVHVAAVSLKPLTSQ